MTTAPTWQAADKSYQLHHVNCPTCAAAGRKPGELQRCLNSIAGNLFAQAEA